MIHKSIRALAGLALLALAASCGGGKEEAEVIPVFSFSAGTEVMLANKTDNTATLKFRTNVHWSLEIPPEASSWLSATPMSGEPSGGTQGFTVTFRAARNEAGGSRKAVVALRYADKSNNVTVRQSYLHSCQEYVISDDMLFSTTLGRNTTNIPQGFDYDPDEDVVYISQKYGAYRNHIGWQKRETSNGTTVAPDYMTLCCFSHGNNFAIEKDASGKKYLWTPNYGTRQSDGSYDSPLIVSRIPLSSGRSLYNKETTENYYFGYKKVWPAFDFDEDLICVCDISKFYVYRLSDLRALPDQNITLDYTITYGGVITNSSGTTIDSKIPEWTGKPVVKAKDCRKVQPLYTVPFDYGKRGLHWQTYCIDDGWIFALLQADQKEAPDIIFDTYVEAYRMDGKENKYKIRQEYIQNRNQIVSYGWNEAEYFYCEPEGIKVYDGIMLVMYGIRGQASDHLIRRPVIFKFASPVD